MPSMAEIAGLPPRDDKGRFTTAKKLQRREKPQREKIDFTKPAESAQPNPQPQPTPAPQPRRVAQPDPDVNPLLVQFISRFPDSDPNRASIEPIGNVPNPQPQPQSQPQENPQPQNAESAEMDSKPMQEPARANMPGSWMKWLVAGSVSVLAVLTLGRVGGNGGAKKASPEIPTPKASNEVVI